MPWAPNLVPTALLRRPCSSLGHGFGTGLIQPESRWIIWERPCLSHPFSLGIAPARPRPGTQHGRCGARVPADSRSMAHAAGGAQRRSGEKREKPNACTKREWACSGSAHGAITCLGRRPGRPGRVPPRSCEAPAARASAAPLTPKRQTGARAGAARGLFSHKRDCFVDAER